MITLDEFGDFVETVHGHRPFPWQTAYLTHVAEAADDAGWPDLDIPTGLGKTSLIDIWTFLLAWQSATGRPRTIPLRLFFVVDRQLVVDQAHEHARTLQHALDHAPAGSVTGRVGNALRSLSGEPTALETVRMRGGADWASRWLRSPAQPAVITSTVDQYGSRLLFRGYHTSPRMRPIDAALCGTDALLAVDEAHIALPLLTTATHCAAYQHTATDPEMAGRAVKVVSLSATASTHPDRPRHSITSNDRQHPVAGARLNARRLVTLWDASTLAKDGAAAFAEAADLAVETMLPVLGRPVVGVVANTIGAARAAFTRLSARADADVVLLTGRCRGHDRTRLLDSAPLQDLLHNRDRQRPLVLVATQTIEVGLDVSFAGLVTENAASSSLIQRLGRLDRTATLPWAPAIVIRTGTHDPDDIPVYGPAAHHTWNWLADHAPATPLHDHTADQLRSTLDQGLLVNPTTLPGLLADADSRELNVPAPRIPLVHRTLIDSWTRTGPAPIPDQPPAPFLHGLNTAPADVQVLWRADLTLNADSGPDWDQWAARMGQIPPHPAETVALPAQHVRRFLTRQPAGETVNDVEGLPATNEPDTSKKPIGMAPALRYDEVDHQWVPATEPAHIRPGSTIALPSTYGGHDAYGWTGRPGEAPATDLGDFPPATDTTPTRLHAPTLALLAGCNEAVTTRLAAAITAATTRLNAGDNDDPPTTVIHQLLDHILETTPRTAAPSSLGDLLHDRLTQLRTIPTWGITAAARSVRTGHAITDPDDPARLILIPARPATDRAERITGVGDDDADASSLTRPVTLTHHSQAVATRAAHYATRLGLPDHLTAAITTSAHAHDCGKHHPRFQCMLCAGDRLLAETLDEPLAKSGMDPADRTTRRRAARLANWHPELRHEALSAAAVHQWLTTNPTHTQGLDHGLITHLVASHHGHARPLLPPVTDPEPTDVSCTMPDKQQITVNSNAMGTDWSGPDRFHALNHHYGPWGLALLETIVRLADMACSEEGN
ncbi:type I-G CRISPR-associated helicase/endonuclease Cas3g [Streptomyces klenkii]|uniref:type I-G CRISPR-associated helicase/endonuclease Cas3g n=1 Tax=Streptomyces klenkii TaxID=1420899 RepID=UPI0034122AF4